MRNRLFGTDGIRARAGSFPLDPATIYRLGCALSYLGHRSVLIGRDTRESGPWISRLLQLGLESGRTKVESAGVIPTPGLAALVRNGGFDAGAVVSASHNPFEDNGIKLVSGSGVKLSDEEEAQIESLVQGRFASVVTPEITPGNTAEGVEFASQTLLEDYLDQLLATLPAGTLSGLRVVLDCANGAAFKVAPALFSRAGCEVEALSARPSGRNINLDCGTLHPERLAETVLQRQADFGVAFDGDADRCILVDEKGEIVDGDDILYILAEDFKTRNEVDSGGVVSTVMANFGLELALERIGLDLVRTPVGDRYVLQEMLRGNHLLGGEQSGHVIVRKYSDCGDGLQTALLVAGIIAGRRVPLSALKGVERLPQILINVPVREKRDLTEVPAIQETIEAVSQSLAERGRVVVRYSGTEPVVRIMLEGDDAEEISGLANDIAAEFERCLGG